jgi:hypothetical protein
MSQVEIAGLWIAIIAGITATVLAVVSILFTKSVDERSSRVTAETIRSLENIQSTVQRLSADTGGLIKVAWDRMVGTMASPEPVSSTNYDVLLEGVLLELRQEAKERAPGTGMEEFAVDVGDALRRRTDQLPDHSNDSPPDTGAFSAATEAI